MIERFTFGKTVRTGAVVQHLESSPSGSVMQFGSLCSSEPFKWIYRMDRGDCVFGLGEQMRGINKRGGLYESWCSDVPSQDEFTSSMYGAHNFLIVYNGSKYNSVCFAVFFDSPARVRFDIGWTDSSELVVTSADMGLDVYMITPAPDRIESELNDVVRQYRHLIGQSYIPPRWAFGFQQSRWGYKTQADVRQVVESYRKNNLPLDAVCLDIDYMDSYKDFTVDSGKFPDLSALSSELKEDGVRLVPIIDAGIKVQEGYDVYEEGHAKGYFCKKEDGSDFTAGVWPGESAFTDFMQDEAALWFGSKYKRLTDAGIEGFWNDMNEPALFYTKDSLKAVFEKMASFAGKNLDIDSFFQFTPLSGSTFSTMEDYKSFYHNVDGEMIRHDKIHNLYGSKMTQAAAEALRKISPGCRMLLYSRASCTGSHRYGGIWTGDNKSTWVHLEQEIKMLPSLNMAGYLYSGADIGGFGGDVTSDLLLRWLALGVFTPLMRNHCAWNGRNQECYAFGTTDDFKSLLALRYALLPYIYSEFVKAALSGGMFIKPIGFDWPDDHHALECEDQLLVGEGIMIAPIYRQNATSRYVYLPEQMTKVTWQRGKVTTEEKSRGSYFVSIPLDAVVFFVRKNCLVPLAKDAMKAKSSADISVDRLDFVGTGSGYRLYSDDGFTRDISDKAIHTVGK
ncbi:MAG: alpha-glucosidase [Treponema sp.]|nr:alpha-glucosidase [Treponema sp.]